MPTYADTLNLENEFIKAVFAQLPPLDYPDTEFLIRYIIRQQYRRGWTIEDTVQFHSVTEDFNTKLDVDDAVKVMQELTAKYRKKS